MKEIFDFNDFLDRYDDVEPYHEEASRERKILNAALCQDEVSIIKLVQKELGYKWGIFSALLHSSLYYYQIGLTNFNPKKYGLIFERYYNSKYRDFPFLSIDLPDKYDLVDFNFIAEKHGYNIKEEETYMNFPGVREYLLFKVSNRKYNYDREYLDEVGKLLNTELSCVKRTREREENEDFEYREAYITVFSNNIIDLLNKILKLIPNATDFLNSYNTKDFKVWQSISKGNVLKFMDDEAKNCIDFFLDYKVDSFDKLMNFFSISKLNKVDYSKEVKEMLLNYHSLGLDHIHDDVSIYSTNGAFMYQEDIIMYLSEIANITIADAEFYRNEIAKRKFESIEKIKKLFLKNQNYSKKTLEIYFDKIYREGQFAFTKSYACKAALELYLLCYLEIYQPKEFQKSYDEWLSEK